MSFKFVISVDRNTKELVTDFQKAFDKAFAQEGQRQALKIAEAFKKDLVAHIEHQVFRHEPLSPGYTRYKRRKHLDPRILIASGEYVRSIQVISVANGAGVGMKRGHVGGDDSAPTFDDLADWLENGTKNRRADAFKVSDKPGGMPPRPHWWPLIERWTAKLNQIAGQLEQAVNKGAVQRLKNKGHIIRDTGFNP